MFETEESFQQKIYILSQKTNQSLLETLTQYCAETGADGQSIASFVTGKLFADLQEECVKYNRLNKSLLPKTRKIPIFLYNNG